MPWISDDSERAINPYNFVTMADNAERAAPVKGPLTGKISCRLITKTPLAIPDTEKMSLEWTNDSSRDKRKKEHKKYPFFSAGGKETIVVNGKEVIIDGKKIIPGSELRGMIRSAFEAVTSSCMSIINSNTLSARHPTPRNPGLIRWNTSDEKWELYNAVRQNNSNNGAVKHNWYCINGITRGSEQCRRRRCSNRQRRRCSGQERYYQREGNALLFSDLDKAVEQFNSDEGIMAIYQKNDEDKYKRVAYSIGQDGEWYVVFYEQVGDGTIYLSPAQVSRSVFHKKLEDLVGDLKPCGSKSLTNKGFCPACRLFGMISKNCSIGGSVRFGDAKLIALEKDSFHYAVLKELAEPKPSSVEFYTQMPGEDALFWNYDYKVTDYISNTEPVRSVCDVKLNGRKFYLHHKTPAYRTSEKTKRNSTMELVSEGSEFEFDIWFEQIDEDQLNELLWILTFGENDVLGGKWHKIGHGKPLGLGSIKIVVDSVKTRAVDVSDELIVSYEESLFAFPKDNPFLGQGYADLERIAETRFENVSYPLGDGGGAGSNRYASHQWFIGNRMFESRNGVRPNGMKPVISKTLPLIRDKSETSELYLSKYVRT